nr:hypothetical protein [uncultured Draconibacterium sp.]
MVNIKEYIDKVVTEIKSADPKESIFNNDLAMAKVYPKGEVEYFKKKKYELYEEMNDDHIGSLWIENNSNDPFMIIEKTGKPWIESYLETMNKHLGSNSEDCDADILEFGNSFLRKYFHVKTVENYLKRLDGNAPIKKNFKLRDDITPQIVNEYYQWAFNRGDIDCSDKEFNAIFSDEDLPAGWKPVKYLRLHNKEPHATALAALIRELTNVTKKEAQKKLLTKMFIDCGGNSIAPNLGSNEEMRDRHLMLNNEMSEELKRLRKAREEEKKRKREESI